MIDLLAAVRQIRRRDGPQAALDYLDVQEQQTSDADVLHSVRVARISLLHSEARYDEALSAARAFLPLASCKTGVYMDIALALYRKGERDAAEAELAKAPLDDERECYGPFVFEAEFFQLFLRNQRGLPASLQELAAFPSDYIQITDKGLRYGLEVLGSDFQGMEY